MGFEKELGAVKVIKDQIQYRSQSLLNLARDYFSHAKDLTTFNTKSNLCIFILIFNEPSQAHKKLHGK